MKRTRRTAPRGLTLIEVVISLTVVTVGLVSAFYLFAVSRVSLTDARNTTQAYFAAQQELEIIRNMPYQSNGSFGGLISLYRPSTAAGTPEGRFLKPDGTDDASRPGDVGYPGLVLPLANLPNGTGGVIITDHPYAGNQCKVVTVVVRWSDRGNVQRQATLSSVIANGGINPR